ncbi:MAG: LD-carboxypeptidase [Candidatus Pacearchaeota archaeon]
MEFKRVFLVASSGNIDKSDLNRAKRRLNKLDFEEILHREDILDKHLSYAGNFLRRADELNDAYRVEDSLISSVKGGMGAIHLLPYLDYSLIKRSKNIFLGYSDVTLLLNSIYQRTGSRCLHGPNTGNKKEFDMKTINCLKDVIAKRNYRVTFNEADTLVKGAASSKIVGGNVELLGRSLGTMFEIDTKDKVVFLEDYKMRSWRVYDILCQLKLAGKFDHVRGVILGYFTECGEDIDTYLRDFFKNFKCPVVMNQPIGHSEPNLTIPIGETCVIDTEKGYWGIRFKK